MNTASVILQYRDEQLEENRIIVFASIFRQNNICVYPSVKPDSVYSINGEYEMTGAEIIKNGIDIGLDECYKTQSIIIKKVK